MEFFNRRFEIDTDSGLNLEEALKAFRENTFLQTAYPREMSIWALESYDREGYTFRAFPVKHSMFNQYLLFCQAKEGGLKRLSKEVLYEIGFTDELLEDVKSMGYFLNTKENLKIVPTPSFDASLKRLLGLTSAPCGQMSYYMLMAETLFYRDTPINMIIRKMGTVGMAFLCVSDKYIFDNGRIAEEIMMEVKKRQYACISYCIGHQISTTNWARKETGSDITLGLRYITSDTGNTPHTLVPVIVYKDWSVIIGEKAYRTHMDEFYVDVFLEEALGYMYKLRGLLKKDTLIKPWIKDQDYLAGVIRDIEIFAGPRNTSKLMLSGILSEKNYAEVKTVQDIVCLLIRFGALVSMSKITQKKEVEEYIGKLILILLS